MKKKFVMMLSICLALMLFPITASADTTNEDKFHSAAGEEIYKVWSFEGVMSGPTVDNVFTLEAPTKITAIWTYHYYWNAQTYNSVDLSALTIKLQNVATDEVVYSGTVQPSDMPPYGKDISWFVFPEIVLPPGTYVLIDPHPASWSYTAETNQKGMCIIKGVIPNITPPSANQNLVYDGTIKTGVDEGVGYNLSGNTATDAGNYTAVAQLVSNYKWSDGSTEDKNIPWSIAKADVTEAPAGLGAVAPATIDGRGEITETTAAMEYSSDESFATTTTCSPENTRVAPGTYYVRYKEDANHNAGQVSATVTVPGFIAPERTVSPATGVPMPLIGYSAVFVASAALFIFIRRKQINEK